MSEPVETNGAAQRSAWQRWSSIVLALAVIMAVGTAATVLLPRLGASHTAFERGMSKAVPSASVPPKTPHTYGLLLVSNVSGWTAPAFVDREPFKSMTADARDAVRAVVPKEMDVEAATYLSNTPVGGLKDVMFVAAAGEFNGKAPDLDVVAFGKIVDSIAGSANLRATQLRLNPASWGTFGCGNGTFRGLRGAICLWFEKRTAGVIFYFDRAPSDIEATFEETRSQIVVANETS